MVGNFVRLKLRLLANRLRTESILGTIGFILLWVAAVLLGVLGGVGVYGLAQVTGEPGIILVVAYTAVFVGWALIPATVSALDDVLDPRRFELLPLTLRRLTVGLLTAGAVGPGGIGTLIALAIATVATFPHWHLLPLHLVVVLAELALCLIVARLVTTVFANLLASRRSRELVTLVFGLVIVIFAFLPALVSEETGFRFEISIGSLEDFGALAWLPPGALAMAMSLFSQGEVIDGLGLVLYGFAALVVIGWGWARALRRMLVSAPVSGRSGRRRNDLDRPLALVPSWLRLPGGIASAMVGKELRYLIRDNRVRAQLLGSVAVLVVVVIIPNREEFPPELTPFLAAGVALFLVIGVLTNQFGYDGGSFWGYVVSSARMIDIVKGKNLTWGILSAPVLFLVATGMAVWSWDFTYLVAGFMASVGVMLIAMASGNLTSIYGAFSIPESNPFGNRGASGGTLVAVLISMAATGALLLPLALVIALPAIFVGPGAATLGSVVGVAYGVVMYRVGLRLTSRLLTERQQALLDTIDGG